jgi:ribonuclease BN (tRNA processing enzyme)
MGAGKQPLDLLFLGSGNAFGSEGRAFSSFLLNGRYLFDCGPTVLQQLHKAGLTLHGIDVILISHFHADHFFGLPFVMLASEYGGRTKPLTIVGPPGIQAQTEALLALGYPGLTLEHEHAFERRYVEVSDGCCAEIEGLTVTAGSVDHVQEFDCFAYHVETDGRSLLYSGDTKLCDGLLRLVPQNDVVILEHSHMGVPVHLSAQDVTSVAAHTSPGTQIVITHLENDKYPDGIDGLIVAQDLWRYRL